MAYQGVLSVQSAPSITSAGAEYTGTTTLQIVRSTGIAIYSMTEFGSPQAALTPADSMNPALATEVYNAGGVTKTTSLSILIPHMVKIGE